jgi:hypothetical protein
MEPPSGLNEQQSDANLRHATSSHLNNNNNNSNAMQVEENGDEKSPSMHIRAEEFSFEDCMLIARKKEAAAMALSGGLADASLQYDPVFAGEITTGLKKQINQMQARLSEIEDSCSPKDFTELHAHSLLRYVALLEDLNEKLTEDESQLTYLYNSAS